MSNRHHYYVSLAPDKSLFHRRQRQEARLTIRGALMVMPREVSQGRHEVLWLVEQLGVSRDYLYGLMAGLDELAELDASLSERPVEAIRIWDEIRRLRER